jgi:hypothetical protein
MTDLTLTMPLREALSTTGLGTKGWRDLIEAKLVDGARRDESSKSYVITRAHVIRLEEIAAARRVIRGRFTLGKLGFALALRGHRWVPVSLLQSELQREVDNYFGLVRRALQRATGLSPRPGTVTENQVYNGAKKLARRLTKRLPQSRRNTAFSACYLFLALSLKMLYLKRPNPLDHAGTMKELLLHTGSVEHKDKGHVGFSFDEARDLASIFAGTLSKLDQVLTLYSSTNILCTSISRVSDDEFWKAFDAANLVETVVIGAYKELRRMIKLPPLSIRIRRKMFPLLLATLIAYQVNPPQDRRLLDELLQGSGQGLRSITTGLLELVRNFLKLQPLLVAARSKTNVK